MYFRTTPARNYFDFSSTVAIDLPQNPEQTSCKVNQQQPTTNAPPHSRWPSGYTVSHCVCDRACQSHTHTLFWAAIYNTAEARGFFKTTRRTAGNVSAGFAVYVRLGVDSLPRQLSLLYVSWSSRDWRVWIHPADLMSIGLLIFKEHD